MATIGDTRLNNIDSKYKAHTRTMIVEEIAEKKSHNIMKIDIASSLNYAKFDEVNYCGTAY